MSRSWLPHPARTIRLSGPCPTGLPRYASLALAMAALTHGLAPTPLTATACQQCGGAHHQPARKDPT